MQYLDFGRKTSMPMLQLFAAIRRMSGMSVEQRRDEFARVRSLSLRDLNQEFAQRDVVTRNDIEAHIYWGGSYFFPAADGTGLTVEPHDKDELFFAMSEYVNRLEDLGVQPYAISGIEDRRGFNLVFGEGEHPVICSMAISANEGGGFIYWVYSDEENVVVDAGLFVSEFRPLIYATMYRQMTYALAACKRVA